MAFDRNNNAHLAALQSEVLSDPAGLGYDPNGNDQQLLRRLNDPSLNPGGETAARVFDAQAMMEALAPADFGASQTKVGAADYVGILQRHAAYYGDISAFKDKFTSMFGTAQQSATRAALDAQTRALSRAQVVGQGPGLWGDDVEIVALDWYKARDYVAP